MASGEMARSFAGALGRVLVAALFLISAVHWMLHFRLATEVLMARHGAPHPRLLTALLLLIELMACLMVLFGWRARAGSVLLLLYALPVSWNFQAPAWWPLPHVLWGPGLWPALALTGALLLLIAHGSGAFSARR